MRFLVFLCALAGTINAQAISVTSLSSLPANPTTTDSVFVAITVATGNQGGLVSLNHSMSGTNVEIEGCYFSGMLPAVDFHYDTIFLGVLPSGTYMVDMNALLSFNTSICDPVDSAQLTTSFTVGTPTPSPPCCIDVVGVSIIPSPGLYDTTHVYIEAGIDLPAQGFVVSDTVYVDGQNIHINACYFTDNIPNANITIDTFSVGVLPAGQYNLILNAIHSIDSLNCTGIDTAVYNRSLFVDSADSGLRQHNFSEEEWRIYPNPASDILTIEGLPLNATIVLMDVQGRVLWRKTTTERCMIINVSDLKSGGYVFSVNGVTQRLNVVNN